MSLKRWTTKKIMGTMGESLRWEALPREELTRAVNHAAPVNPPLVSVSDPNPACGLAPAPGDKTK